MDCLARREHSFHELQEKLRNKCPGAGMTEIRDALTRLRDENLQSDERFAEAYVRYRQNRGYGYLHIRQELQRRGIPEMLIARMLDPEDERWELILNDLVLRRSFPAISIVPGGREYQRLARFLQGRGFRDGEIRLALKPYLKP